MDYVSVATTINSADAAKSLATAAVEARLAACAHIEGPLESVYWWQGNVETAHEWRITFKTTAARYGALETFVTERHPYETPEVLAHAVVGGSAQYLAWLEHEVEGR